MKQPSRYKWIKRTAAALSLSLIAAALTLVLNGTAGPLHNWGETVSRPFLRLFSGLSEPIRQGEAYFAGIKTLQEENDSLRKEVETLRKTAGEGELAASENVRLRALLGWTADHPDMTLEPARIIARSPDNWQSLITLDIGEDRGVRPGQCVMDGQGALVGRVKTVGNRWCQTALLNDPSFCLAGIGCQSEVLGELHGKLEGLTAGTLSFSGLDGSEAPKLGEDILTYAAGEGYPSGLLVGNITYLTKDPGGLTRSGVVTPAADLTHPGEVFVITEWGES